MPIAQSDQVFKLIKSLDKAEKRNFTLYSTRLNSNKEVLFLKLFNVMDKMKTYNEELIKKKFPNLTRGQLTNAKRHLYSQILKSLRLIHSQKNIDIQIREQIDFAKILYGKGLYLQSLKLLERIKPIAQKANQDILTLEILEFEKKIESRHITRSRKVKNKVEGLIDESAQVKNVVGNASELLNLKLKIHGLYIKLGHAKDEKDLFIIKDYFYSNLPKYRYKSLRFFEKVYLHQSYVWYYYTILNHAFTYRHAYKWVDLFRQKPIMKNKDPDLYMRGLHYLMTSLFYSGQSDKMKDTLDELKSFHSSKDFEFNETSNMMYFIYSYNAQINKNFLDGTFQNGLKLVPEIKENIRRFEMNLDHHRAIVFYYKIAWLHLGNNDPERALDYLNIIINLKKENLRDDIKCFTRLLHLFAHLELKNFELVDNLMSSVERLFNKSGESSVMTDILFDYVKTCVRIKSSERKEIATKFLQKIRKNRYHQFERRVFNYFHFLEWFEAKSENETMGKIIYEARQKGEAGA